MSRASAVDQRAYLSVVIKTGNTAHYQIATSATLGWHYTNPRHGQGPVLTPRVSRSSSHRTAPLPPPARRRSAHGHRPRTRSSSGRRSPPSARSSSRRNDTARTSLSIRMTCPPPVSGPLSLLPGGRLLGPGLRGCAALDAHRVALNLPDTLKRRGRVVPLPTRPEPGCGSRCRRPPATAVTAQRGRETYAPGEAGETRSVSSGEAIRARRADNRHRHRRTRRNRRPS